MKEITVDYRKVKVSEDFFDLSAEEQAENLEQIAAGMEFTEDELKAHPGWINNSKTIYFMNEGKDARPLESDAEYAEYALDYMGWFNYNFSKMGYEIAQLQSAETQQKQSMLYLMNHYDQKNISWAGTGRFFKGALSDPTNLVGIGTLGLGFLGKAGVKKASIEGFKSALQASVKTDLGKRVAATSVVGGVDGAVLASADNLGRQEVRMEAGAQGELDYGELGTAAGVGFAAGGTLGAALPVAGRLANNLISRNTSRNLDAVTDRATDVVGEQANEAAPKLKEQPDLFEGTPSAAPRALDDIKVAEQEAVAMGADLVRKATKSARPEIREAGERVAQLLENQVKPDEVGLRESVEVILDTFQYSQAELATNAQLSQAVGPLARFIGSAFMENPKMMEELLGSAAEFDQNKTKAIQEAVRAVDRTLAKEQLNLKALLEESPELADDTDIILRVLEVNKAKAATEVVDKDIGSGAAKIMQARKNPNEVEGLDVDAFERGRAQGLSVLDSIRFAEEAAADSLKAKEAVDRAKRVLKAVIEFRANALLSGPATQLINTFSALTNLYARPVFEYGGTFMRLGNRQFNKRQRKRITAQMLGYHHSLRETYHAARKAFVTEKSILSPSTRFDLDEETAFSSAQLKLDGDKAFGKAVDATGRKIRIISRFMRFTDEFFKQMAYKGEIIGNATMDGLDQGLRDADLQRYIDEQLNAAFREDGSAKIALAQTEAEKVAFVNQFDKTSKYWAERAFASGEDMLKYGGGIGRLIMPFYRAPVRIMDIGMRMSGVSLLGKFLPGHNKFYDDLSGRNGIREMAEARAQLAFGISVYGMTVLGVANGTITGGQGGKRDYKRAREKGIESPPYSIKLPDFLGGGWLDYSRYQPFSTPMMIMADIAEGARTLNYRDDAGYYDSEDESKLLDSAFLAVSAVSQATVSPTFMEGIDQFVKLINAGLEGEASFEKFAGQYTSSFIPNIFKKAANYVDPAVYEAKTYTDAVLAPLKLGGSTQRDIYGQVRERNPNTGMFMAPQEGDDDPVRAEVNRVAELRETHYDFPASTSFIKGRDIATIETADGKTSLYDRYKELSGTVKIDGLTLKEALQATFNKPGYQQIRAGLLTDESSAMSKHKIIQTILSKYRTRAKETLLATDEVYRDLLLNQKKRTAKSRQPVDELLR